jgi:hypothetical protein
MEKISLRLMRKEKNPRDISLQSIKKALGKNNACYVLITCGEPSEDGKMQVEMSYEGDQTLAAYLVESAQNVFDHQIEESLNSQS